MNVHPRSLASDRRRFLWEAGGGAAGIALAAWLGEGTRPGASLQAADLTEPSARSTVPPHFPPRAKRVIWLFMHGGPSHVDLFDPKPELNRYAGQPLPDSFGQVMTRRDVARNPLLGPLKPFRPRGNSGLEISDFLPHLSECADDLCVIRSLHGDSVNHPQSVYQMNTGSILMGRPSFGSWLAYGLGSENNDMPAFVVLPDPGGGIKGGPPAWSSGFLPARHQGVTMRPGARPVLNLRAAADLAPAEQREMLDVVQTWNRQHRATRDDDDELAARISSHELAFRMQTAAPELVDFADETETTLQLYGVDDPATRELGSAACLPGAWSNEVFAACSFTRVIPMAGTLTMMSSRITANIARRRTGPSPVYSET